MGHPDPRQQSLGQGFLNAAIQEMDAAEQPTPKHDDGIKAKGEHFVKEELLEGGDKSGTDGSEQSTDNGQDFPQVADQSENGQKDMEKAEGTENQMTESFPPMMGQMPGLDPQLAQSMAPNMPQLPPMSTPQQIQQMQYTVKEMIGKIMETQIRPLQKQVVALTKANTFLSNQVKEITTLKTGLDLHAIDRNAPGIQETMMPSSVSNVDAKVGQTPRIYEKAYNLESERQKIIDLDKMVSSSSTIYQ